MIVVDASVWVRALTDSTATGHAARAELARDEEWIAPAHMPIEVLRTLARLERGKHLTTEQADGFAEAVTSAEVEYEPPGGWHYEMIWANRHNINPYDGAYVALADMYSAPLVTLDLRLARAARKHSTIDVIVPGTRPVA